MQKIAAALAKFQTLVQPIPKAAKAQYGDYADLDSMLEAIKAPLAQAGLVVMQAPISATDEHSGALIGIKTTIIEVESGENVSSSILLPTSGVPNKNVAQAAGSLLTYLRRYSLAGSLCLSARDDDADSLDLPKSFPEQAIDWHLKLKNYMLANKVDAEKAKEWCREYSVEKLTHLTIEQVKDILGE